MIGLISAVMDISIFAYLVLHHVHHHEDYPCRLYGVELGEGERALQFDLPIPRHLLQY